MNCFFEPINVNHWNMFDKVKHVGHIETFLATRDMHVGDTMVLHVGKQIKKIQSGIYAVGTIISEPYILKNHPDDYCNDKDSVDVKIFRINYNEPIVNEEECKRIFRQFRSVHEVPQQQAILLKEYLSEIDAAYPDEIDSIEEKFSEGKKIQVSVNAYERNPEARQKCIEKYGAKCQICGFDFGKVYGKKFADKIHVHHIKPLCEISVEYVIDPEKDLIPVCPNCHMILHSKIGGVYTPDEVRNMIAVNSRNL